jgi:hypothetical protein
MSSVGGKVSPGDGPPGELIPDLPVKCPDSPPGGRFCVTFGKNHATFSEKSGFSRRRVTCLFGSLCAADLACDQGSIHDDGEDPEIGVLKCSLHGGLIPNLPVKCPDSLYRGRLCVTFGKNHATFSKNRAFPRRRRTCLFGSLCAADLPCDQGSIHDETDGPGIGVFKFSCFPGVSSLRNGL